VRSINQILQDHKPVIFLGSSTGMHNQIEMCRGRGRSVAGIVDSDYSSQTHLHGLPILNFDKLDPTQYEFFVATFWTPFDGAVFERNRRKRQELLSFMREHALSEATLIHPVAVVSEGALIASNVSIGAMSYISHGAVIKQDVLIREQCFIGHDVVIESNTVIQTKANITSQIDIQANCYIGLNSTLVNGKPLQRMIIPQDYLVYPNEVIASNQTTTVSSRRRLRRNLYK